jgi:pimeloyl-ACP methyl ester carboxylesterase
MRKIVPLLTDPGRHGGDPTDAFDVVVPSLPGYGFSDPLPGRGATRRIPALWVRLMAALGYPRFAAFGSDIGAWVTNRLGHEHPDRVIGIAVTQLAEPYLGAGTPALSDRERAYLAQRARSAETNSGYAHIQRTKPQTLAFGLADSPVGLAAWIVDRYQSWSDCSGDVERRFSKDDLLTVVTLYWATQTIRSSFHVYREWALASALTPGAHEVYPDEPTGADATPFGPGERITVPAAIVLPRGDNAPPREWAERAYNVQRWTKLPRGGHFLAFEEPTLLVEELRAFFRPLR